MRILILSVALGSFWPFSASADTAKPIDCAAANGCLRGFMIEGFQMLAARPVPLPGNRVALLGVDGLVGDSALWLLDPSINDGSIAGPINVEIGEGELGILRELLRAGWRTQAEISPSGVMLALFLGGGQPAGQGGHASFLQRFGKVPGACIGAIPRPLACARGP